MWASIKVTLFLPIKHAIISTSMNLLITQTQIHNYLLSLVTIFWQLRPCLDFCFLITHHFSLNFRHSSLITHHSSLKTPHPVWHQHSVVITQYFSTVYGTHPLTQCQLTFLSPFFFFFFPHLSPSFFSAFLFIHVNAYFNQAHHNPYFHTFPRSTI